jgi:hypothetical protein
MISLRALALSALVAIPLLGIADARAGKFTRIGFIKPEESGYGTVTGVLATDSDGDLLAETSFAIYRFKVASNYAVQQVLYDEFSHPSLGRVDGIPDMHF